MMPSKRLLGVAFLAVVALAAASSPSATAALGKAFQEWRAGIIDADYIDWDGTQRQVGEWDCGVAVAGMMLLQFRADTAHLAEARAEVEARGRGLSLLELREFMEAGGVAATGVETDMAMLATFEMPVVAHLPDHYVVVDSVRAGGVFVRDPARGRLRVDLGAFARLWTGHALVIGLNTEPPVPPEA